MVRLFPASVRHWIKWAGPIAIVEKGAPHRIELNGQVIEVHQRRRLWLSHRLFARHHLFLHHYTHTSFAQSSCHRALTASSRARLTNRSAKSRSVQAMQLPPIRVQPPRSRVQPIDGTEHKMDNALSDSYPSAGA